MSLLVEGILVFPLDNSFFPILWSILSLLLSLVPLDVLFSYILFSPPSFGLIFPPVTVPTFLLFLIICELSTSGLLLLDELKLFDFFKLLLQLFWLFKPTEGAASPSNLFEDLVLSLFFELDDPINIL